MRWILLICLAGCQLASGAAFYVETSGLDSRATNVVIAGKPYNGSTADQLDDFLRKVPEYSTIYFGRHGFETRGVWDVWLGNLTKGFRLKSGWTLIGAGTNTITGTVLRLVDVPIDSSGDYEVNVVLSTGGVGRFRADQPLSRRPNIDDVTIRDLQLDCNYPYLARATGKAALQLSGIQILGNRNITISNVWVRNAVSKKSDSRGNPYECFQVYIYNEWALKPPGSYFLDQVAVTDYQGGYTSAICVNGLAGGHLRNCTVVFPEDRTARFGLNFAAGLHQFQIENNTVWNASRGINNDTGPICTEVTIRGNRLVHCDTGMQLSNSQNNQILGNTLWLTGKGSGICIWHHPTLANVRSGACSVSGNILIGARGEGISLAYRNEFDPKDRTLYWSSNNLVQYNIVSPGLQNKIPPATLAPNTVRPGNRRYPYLFPACGPRGQEANIVGLGFPSDIGPGSTCAYCPARAADSRLGYITRVKLGGTKLDMISDAGDGSGYSDFTTGYPAGVGANQFQDAYYVQWADLRRGRAYPLQIETGHLLDPRTASFRVFIDWDHDGRFDGLGELVAASQGKPALATHLICPAQAPLGSTRMRVILGCGRTPGPCEAGTFFGEVEDYTVNVVQ
jgi:hypothetical protein